MKEIKLMLSPFVGAPSFKDEVSGMEFTHGDGFNAKIYTINIEAMDASGIQKALQRNVLLPYDEATLQFVKSTNLSAAPVTEEIVVETVAAAETSEDEVKEDAPKKKGKSNK